MPQVPRTFRLPTARQRPRISKGIKPSDRLINSWQWRKPGGTREAYLNENPVCVKCREQGRLTPATNVDHVRPHNEDPELFWDWGNYQALCQSCHSKKTAKEDGGFGNGNGGGVV